jgi:hypothetical protein
MSVIAMRKNDLMARGAKDLILHLILGLALENIRQLKGAVKVIAREIFLLDLGKKPSARVLQRLIVRILHKKLQNVNI